MLNILEMSGERMNCLALTQSEVLNFVGWFPFCMREDFDQYYAEHPKLEPFLPTDYGFRTSEHIAED